MWWFFFIGEWVPQLLWHNCYERLVQLGFDFGRYYSRMPRKMRLNFIWSSIGTVLWDKAKLFQVDIFYSSRGHVYFQGCFCSGDCEVLNNLSLFFQIVCLTWNERNAFFNLIKCFVYLMCGVCVLTFHRLQTTRLCEERFYERITS